jgi:hypothetical protein
MVDLKDLYKLDNRYAFLKTAPFSKSTFFSKDLIPLNVGINSTLTPELLIE